MRVRRAKDRGVQHARRVHVVDEPAGARDEPVAAQPGVRLAYHGDVTLTEIAQTLELLRQRRIRAIVSRTFPLEEAEEAHELLRTNALAGRAALILAS